MFISADKFNPKPKKGYWWKPAITVTADGGKQALTDTAILFLEPPPWRYEEIQGWVKGLLQSKEDATANFAACIDPVQVLWIEKTEHRYLAWFRDELAIDGRYYEMILSRYPDVQFKVSLEDETRIVGGESFTTKMMAFFSDDEVKGWVMPLLVVGKMPDVFEITEEN